MESIVYNNRGEQAGKIELPESLFGVQWNANLVHQVVLAMQANARGFSSAHTKDRGEVRGGGKKPWAQKGTGRARHGSSRSPIWRGGGVAHGPRNEKDYSQKINRQVRQKALLVALSRKFKDGEIIFIDSLEMTTPKTATAQAIINALSKAGFVSRSQNAMLIALPNTHQPTIKSFRNIPRITVEDIRNLNPIDVFSSKYLVIANPEAAIETLSKKRVVKAPATK